MSVSYFYNRQSYATEQEVNAAVTELKTRLENNPTDWVIVKEVTGSAEDGWTVNPTKLTDEEILNLDPTKHYNVSSVISGDTHIGLDGTEATAKVYEIRTIYATYIEANTIYHGYPPTSEDMSGYVSSV